MSGQLPELVTVTKLARELSVTRAAAEAIFRKLPKQRLPGFQRVYVRRSDVQKYLDENRVAA